LILRTASDNAQFMRTVVVNRSPTSDLYFWNFSWIYSICCEIISEDNIASDEVVRHKRLV